jgi:futalosine hydrolase
MSRKILIIFATEAEADAFRRIAGPEKPGGEFVLGDNEISVLVTGVGTMATAWSMAKWFSANPKPDLAVNAGISGSFRDDIVIGDVVLPVSDCFADAGIEDERGFMTLTEAGLADPDSFPFTGGRLEARNQYVESAETILRPVSAITVNTISGSQATINRRRDKFNPDIETMEGAAFFYICIREGVPFLAIRSVSNRVEPRNRNSWNIPLAVDNLSAKMKELFLLPL